MTPWRGALQAPSILAREQPVRSEADVARLGELDRLAFEPVDLSDVSPRVRRGLRSTRLHVAGLSRTIRPYGGLGWNRDGPIRSPPCDAACAPRAPGRPVRGRSRQRPPGRSRAGLGPIRAARTLLRQLGRRIRQPCRLSMAWRELGAPAQGRRRPAVDGQRPRRTRAAGDRATRPPPSALLDVPSFNDSLARRGAFDAIRAGTREIPGAASRLPDAVWSQAAARLDSWIADAPAVQVTARTARTFERPHGRWSPFVRGDLATTADPAARGAVYLAPRELTRQFPVTPRRQLWSPRSAARRSGAKRPPRHSISE